VEIYQRHAAPVLLRGFTANCRIIAQILRFSHCFQGRFCKLPLFRVIFNRKLGDYYANIRSSGGRLCVSTLRVIHLRYHCAPHLLLLSFSPCSSVFKFKNFHSRRSRCHARAHQRIWLCLHTSVRLAVAPAGLLPRHCGAAPTAAWRPAAPCPKHRVHTALSVSVLAWSEGRAIHTRCSFCCGHTRQDPGSLDARKNQVVVLAASASQRPATSP
jgi:hypothetical protein